MNEIQASIKQVEAHNAVCLPDAVEYETFGRLAWVIARLRSLSCLVCEEHSGQVECFELSGSRALIGELLTLGEAAGLKGRLRGYPGDVLHVTVGDKTVSLTLSLAGRRSRLTQPDIYLLWPNTKGCPPSCANLPEKGIYGIAPAHGPDDVPHGEFELRWALQIRDGMKSADAVSAARLLSN